MTRFKIAVVGVGCENATFSPLQTQLEDFSTSSGSAEIAKIYEKLTNVEKGTRLDLTGSIPPLERGFDDVEFVFISRYRAMPGGVIAKGAFQKIWDDTEQGLKAQASSGIDAVWLDFHGAMNAEGIDDCEGHISTMVRDILGKDILVCASFDLHGNFSRQLAENVDICTAYRTAPHVDVVETRIRAINLLVTSLRNKVRPVLTYVKVPLVISGEMSNTADEPSKTLYTSVLHEADALPSIVDASILVGYCWADEPRSGTSVLVTSTDAETGEREALRIASAIWNARSEFRFGVPAGTIKEVLDMVPTVSKPLVISDSGDNPTAGGVGDATDVLKAIVERDPSEKYLVQGPVDHAAVMMCIEKHSIGDKVSLSLGGKLDNKNSQPFTATFQVAAIHREEVSYPFVYEGAEYTTTMPPYVLLTYNNVTVVVASKRKPLHYDADFAQLQLKLSDFAVVVIKLGYLVPDLEKFAASNLMMLSPGAVFADLPNTNYERVTRPFYPKDPDMEWVPHV